MYITNVLSEAAQVQCPVVCKQQWHLYINLFGFLFGLFSLASYLVRKKYFLHIRSKKKKIISKSLYIFSFVSLFIFVVYFLKIGYHNIGDGCKIDGVLLHGSFFPEFLRPFFVNVK